MFKHFLSFFYFPAHRLGAETVQVVLLDMSHVSVVDVSGLEVMEEQFKGLSAAGKQLVLCGLSRQPLRMLSRCIFQGGGSQSWVTGAC